MEPDEEEVGDVASGTAVASVAFRFHAAPLPLADNAFLSTTGFALGGVAAVIFGIGGDFEVAGAAADGVVVLAPFALEPVADRAFFESGVSGRVCVWFGAGGG